MRGGLVTVTGPGARAVLGGDRQSGTRDPGDGSGQTDGTARVSGWLVSLVRRVSLPLTGGGGVPCAALRHSL